MFDFDFSDLKDSAIKNRARMLATETLYGMVLDKVEDGKASLVGASEFSIAIGKDSEGNEVCVNIKITAKDFKTYDRLAAQQEYQLKTNKPAKVSKSKKSIEVVDFNSESVKEMKDEDYPF